MNFFISPGMYFKVVVEMSRAIDGDFIPRNAGDSSSFLDVIGHPGLIISSSFPMPTPALLHSLVMIAGNHKPLDGLNTFRVDHRLGCQH